MGGRLVKRPDPCICLRLRAGTKQKLPRVGHEGKLRGGAPAVCRPSLSEHALLVVEGDHAARFLGAGRCVASTGAVVVEGEIASADQELLLPARGTEDAASRA